MSMTKEQEEAIETVEGMVKSYIEADECGLSNNDFKNQIRAMQTVLNMLKEKDKEINSQNGTINALKCALKERTEERDRKDDIITKLNKQIDLMADYMLSGLEDIAFNNICKQGYCAHELKDNRPTKFRKCKECIKQKFAGEK